MRAPDICIIRPQSLTIMPQYIRDNKKSSSHPKTSNIRQYFSTNTKPINENNQQEKEISIASKKKVKDCINNLIAISDVKKCYDRKTKKSFTFLLNFITLTLSSAQRHDDKFIKRYLLEPFLKWAQYNHKLNSYVWKAETQKNGNIHFHITTNIFIHYKAIRNKWNSLQSIYGYIPARYTMYEDDVPNSTDVHSVRSIKSCVSYMVKYLLKVEPDKRKVIGQLWNSSKNLKIKPPQIETECIENYNEFNEWKNKYVRYTFENDFCTIMYVAPENQKYICSPFKKAYLAYLALMKENESTTKYYQFCTN